jgi:hypothetical protein
LSAPGPPSAACQARQMLTPHSTGRGIQWPSSAARKQDVRLADSSDLRLAQVYSLSATDRYTLTPQGAQSMAMMFDVSQAVSAYAETNLASQITYNPFGEH